MVSETGIKKHDAVIVGGGIAGLTSAAFLCKWGKSVLLCEKDEDVGGLIGTFDYNGFKFDSGIRATENSGILFPMLKQLGIEIDFLANPVSIGIEDYIMNVGSGDSLMEYQTMLETKFPGNIEDISVIMNEIKLIMDYMDILYGIDNPLFLDFKADREYMLKEVFPWVFKYISKVGKIKRFAPPVDEFLEGITKNRELIDIIAQHFFTKTPASFALSYFSLYMDYKYPRGGTGTIIKKLEEFILENGGEIKTNTEIEYINYKESFVKDSKGNKHEFSQLIWTADNKKLYEVIDLDNLSNKKETQAVIQKREYLADKKGGDSVLTLYLTVDLEPEFFSKISGAHFFYTPCKEGLGKIASGIDLDEKEKVIEWLEEFFRLNTYEISIPVLRDPQLAPPGKTGLIISVLVDHSMIKHINDSGWYEEFKELSKENIIRNLENSIYKNISKSVTGSLVSSPLTLERLKGNTDGAITGWAFTNNEMPAISKMTSIAKSVKTPLKNIHQAGQWTYSPAGMPISVLTGKMAADQVIKKI